MMKSILLASAVMIFAPAFAQDMQDPQVPPTQEQPAPDTMTEPTPQPVPTPSPAPAPMAEPTPAPTPAPDATPDGMAEDEASDPAAEPQETNQPGEVPESAPPPQETAEVGQPASGQQPASAVQIAQIVDQGFPSYDKDADGSLKPEEFGSWMVALRSASEPAFTGESAADKEWIGRALAAADADQSGGITKDELKTFLAPAAAS